MLYCPTMHPTMLTDHQAEESLGMAMVFTLVSQLQEAVRDLVDTRVARRSQEAADTARREVEVRMTCILANKHTSDVTMY